jgi:hypothetical protein
MCAFISMIFQICLYNSLLFTTFWFLWDMRLRMKINTSLSDIWNMLTLTFETKCATFYLWQKMTMFFLYLNKMYGLKSLIVKAACTQKRSVFFERLVTFSRQILSSEHEVYIILKKIAELTLMFYASKIFAILCKLIITKMTCRWAH